MTAAELIAELQKYPPETPVVIYDGENHGGASVYLSIQMDRHRLWRMADGTYSLYADASRNVTQVLIVS